MTLKSRNRLLLAFITGSSLLFIFSSLRLGLSIYNNTITIPENLIRPVSISLPDAHIFSKNFYAASASILFFCLYAIVVTIFLYVHFEKTQSIEVIDCMAFVIGCLLEDVRIFVPIDGLWSKTSAILALTGRTVITGRIAAPLGLLFSVVFNETEQRQYVERNFVILFIIAITLGQIYPISTVKLLSTFTVQMGERLLFNAFQCTLMISTIIIIFYEGMTNHAEKLSRQIMGCTMLMAGYKILYNSDCYMMFSIGVVLITAGSVTYLKYLHSQYLWK
ncbi:MAG: hypothetical protein IJ828_08750 [Treponema sp.]|nr:hypothetical protein [Treponema sp.]